MAWQDVMSWYTGRDDEPEPHDPGELLTLPCPGCGKMVTAPADAPEDGWFCSDACIRVVLDKMQAEYDAAMAEVYAREAAAAQDPAPAGAWDDIPY